MDIASFADDVEAVITQARQLLPETPPVTVWPTARQVAEAMGVLGVWPAVPVFQPARLGDDSLGGPVLLLPFSACASRPLLAWRVLWLQRCVARGKLTRAEARRRLGLRTWDLAAL